MPLACGPGAAGVLADIFVSDAAPETNDQTNEMTTCLLIPCSRTVSESR
jgi:hypothetical protein